MAYIVYGTHVFTKLAGYYGPKEECPVCGRGVELKNKEAKAEMAVGSDGQRQEFEAYVKHILSNKPTGMFSTDNSYEFWIKDLVSGEEIRVASQITKDEVKKMKKGRGYKKVPIINA